MATETSKEWILGIYPEPLESIRNFGKEVEGRVPDPKDERKSYGEMEPGDTIKFELRDGEQEPRIIDLEFTITYVNHYDTIQEMLEQEELNRVLPTVETIEEGVKRYHSFAGYERRVKEHGVYAIGIERQ